MVGADLDETFENLIAKYFESQGEFGYGNIIQVHVAKDGYTVVYADGWEASGKSETFVSTKNLLAFMWLETCSKRE